jgi:cbb3-type cytochrome oxidase cytochrome c subunit
MPQYQSLSLHILLPSSTQVVALVAAIRTAVDVDTAGPSMYIRHHCYCCHSSSVLLISEQISISNLALTFMEVDHF